jgi:hypothetical protein
MLLILIIMAIKIRKSEDYLHTEVILNKIGEYDIFKYYCPQFERLGKKFCSPLREDNSPTVSIIEWNGHLLYKDFGRPEHTFNCFSFIKTKYRCDFYSALRIIDMDFGLGLGSKTNESKFTMGYKGLTYNKKIEAKPVVIIKKKKRKWNKKDAEFWKQFNISKKTLIKFNVEPISHYWINENRFTCKTITYAYRIKNKYKIYAPLEEDKKWFSNTTSKQIQGWEQLPANGNGLIITSSLKDIMCLYELGYNAVAFQSEMQIPSQKIIDELYTRFENIYLFYDNDYTNEDNPGQNMAKKIMSEYKIKKNIVIDSKYCAKDVSDLIKSKKFKIWLEEKNELNQIK